MPRSFLFYSFLLITHLAWAREPLVLPTHFEEPAISLPTHSQSTAAPALPGWLVWGERLTWYGMWGILAAQAINFLNTSPLTNDIPAVKWANAHTPSHTLLQYLQKGASRPTKDPQNLHDLSSFFDIALAGLLELNYLFYTLLQHRKTDYVNHPLQNSKEFSHLEDFLALEEPEVPFFRFLNASERTQFFKAAHQLHHHRRVDVFAVPLLFPLTAWGLGWIWSPPSLPNKAEAQILPALHSLFKFGKHIGIFGYLYYRHKVDGAWDTWIYRQPPITASALYYHPTFREGPMTWRLIGLSCSLCFSTVWCALFLRS